MAQLAVAGGGAAIGAVVGSIIPGVGTLAGAQIGWAIGGVAGALLFPEKLADQQGPRLNDLNIQTSGYGVAIPLVANRAKLAGNVIWSTDIVEERRTRKTGGKGGPVQKTTEFEYFGNFAVGLCEWLIPPTTSAVLKIWLDTILVYDSTGSSEVQSVPGLNWRYYPGNETQLPDPLIESEKGAGNAPAYRGTAYIVFERLPLKEFGNSRLPNVTVELVGDPARTFPEVVATSSLSTEFASTFGAPRSALNFGTEFVIDHARGRIYESRTRTSGTGNYRDYVIRVYDLNTLEAIAEYNYGDIIISQYPLGDTPDSGGSAPGLLHMGVDGFLYVCGGGYTRVPVYKINVDAWRVDGLFGPVDGANAFGDVGREAYIPLSMTSFQVPRIGTTPRTFLAIGGSNTALMIVDADFMEYVWGAGDITVEPPKVNSGLSIVPLGNPFRVVVGATNSDGSTDVYVAWGANSPSVVLNLARIRVYSGAADTGGGVAMGLFRQDFTLDLAANGITATVPTVLAGFWDSADESLVFLLSNSGSAITGYSGGNLLKWNPLNASATWVRTGLPSTAFEEGAGPDGDLGRSFGSLWGYGGNVVVQKGTGDVLVNDPGVSGTFGNRYFLDEALAVLGRKGNYSSAITKRYLNRQSGGTLTVGQVVEAICLRCGLEITDIDTDALSDPIRGYTLARPMSGRSAIEPLAAAFLFDAVEEDDIIVFKKRGASSVATIPYRELIRPQEDQPAVEERRAQDAELPRRVTVRFADIERGWEQNAQEWSRPKAPTASMASVVEAGFDLPIPITATEGRAIAKRFCVATWRERTSLTFRAGPKYLRLSPTDTITVGMKDGASLELRILKTVLGSDWTVEIEAVVQDARVYDLNATGDSGEGWREPVLPAPYFTAISVPNAPLLSPGDDLGGAAFLEYGFLLPYNPASWRGATLFRSEDGAVYDDLDSITRKATWGGVVSISAPSNFYLIDTVGTVTVQLNNGELETITEAQLYAGENLALLVQPSGDVEVFQFQTAEDLGDNRWRLSNLIRGRFGSEKEATLSAVGAQFILLDDPENRILFQDSSKTATRYFRAPNVYQTVLTAPATVTKSARGRAEQPWPVALLSASRDGSNNLSFSWRRRTRFNGEWLDGTETVPLNEASESYEIDIRNGPELPEFTRSYSGGGAPANAFDGNPTTFTLLTTIPSAISVIFGRPLPARGYGVRGATAIVSESPNTWTFEGWDGSSWTVLDTRSGISGWSAGELRRYSLSEKAEYLGYRLLVTALNGGGFWNMPEFAVYPVTGGADIARSGAYAPAVVRTITATSPSATYTAAQQTTDFGVAIPEVYAVIYQMSAQAGRGLPKEVIL